MSNVSGTVDIIHVADVEANFTGARIKSGMFAMTSDTNKFVTKKLADGSYRFHSDDTKQVLLAGAQNITGTKTFQADQIIDSTSNLFFNNITTGGRLNHNGTDFIIKNLEDEGEIIFETTNFGRFSFNGGTLGVQINTNATSTLTGSIRAAGGIACVKDIYCGGNVTIDSTNKLILNPGSSGGTIQHDGLDLIIKNERLEDDIELDANGGAVVVTALLLDVNAKIEVSGIATFTGGSTTIINGDITTIASTSGATPLVVTPGVTPSTPTAGGIWMVAGSGLNFRDSAVNYKYNPDTATSTYTRTAAVVESRTLAANASASAANNNAVIAQMLEDLSNAGVIGVIS